MKTNWQRNKLCLVFLHTSPWRIGKEHNRSHPMQVIFEGFSADTCPYITALYTVSLSAAALASNFLLKASCASTTESIVHHLPRASFLAMSADLFIHSFSF